MNTLLADKRLIRARANLVQTQPFFGTLLMYLQIVERPEVETMATDGQRLYYAAPFVDQLSDPELEGVLIHEVLHCAYKHHLRRGHRNPDKWNEACDYAINRDLDLGQFTLPPDRLYDPQYHGLGAEEIYARRGTPPQPQSGGQGGGGGTGGGSKPTPGKGAAGGPPQGPSKAQQGGGTGGGSKPTPSGGSGPAAAPGALGGGGTPTLDQPSRTGASTPTGPGPGPWGRVLDAVSSGDGTLGEQEAEWETRVRQAMNVAKKQAGRLPGNLQGIVEELEKPKHDWRSRLREFVDDKCRTDYSWTQPNKRMLSAGLTLPGQVKDGVSKLAIVVDTSGSVNDRMLNMFLAEVQEVLDMGGVSEIILVHCDTKVQMTWGLHEGEIIPRGAYGRGGTMFSPAFRHINDLEPDVAGLVYFTDLECDDFGPEPDYPVLWAAVGYERTLKSRKVPFGEVMVLDPATENV